MFLKGRLRLIWCFAAFAFLGQVHAVACGQEDGKKNHLKGSDKVKAIYLYSLGRFTSWPEKYLTNEGFRIAVVGESGVLETLDRIARRKKIGGKKIGITRYGENDKVASNCHILFISGSIPEERQNELIKQFLSNSILVVTEGKVRRKGAAVNLILDSHDVEFEIDIDMIQKKNLAMDARLLRQGRRMFSSRTEDP